MNITAQVVTFFRSFYPEFTDDAVFPDAAVIGALEDGDEETGSSRWGSYVQDKRNFKSRGMFAYAAHKLVINRAVRRATEAGRIAPGAAQVQSKSVGDESVAYAVGAPMSSTEAIQSGDLKATAYGTEFLRLRKRAGMGPAVV